MHMSLARAVIAIGIVSSAMVSAPEVATAQNRIEKEGVVLPGGQANLGLFCQKAGRKIFERCTPAEAKAGAEYRNAVRRNYDMQREMAAEARAYQKMTQDRQRRAPTTELCYMKNGKLECKPS